MIDRDKLTEYLKEDPDKMGFAALIEEGRPNALAALMNAKPDEETPSKAEEMFGTGAFVSDEDCSLVVFSYYEEIAPEHGGANGPIEAGEPE